ncbi:MAG: methionyl-tRNA formyltransferase [Longimicrobiales bacterium]
MRILFWGTPAFAVPSLRALSGEGHEIAGVVTQPDRPAGRGQELRAPPVKQWAVEEGIPVLQPERPVGADFLESMRRLGPELSVVAAYGQILRKEVLELPPHGSINVHASLLPELRGAAPINWAIIRGHQTTGITIMRMVETLDAGPIMYQVEEPIVEDETASELAIRLAEVGAEVLVEALALMEADASEEREQDHERATYAPRILRANARIDWSRAAQDLALFVRGMDEIPGAWTTLRGTELKLFRPLPFGAGGAAPPGTVVAAGGPEGIIVACGDGTLAFREVKPAGKRRMNAEAWARGRGVAPGDRFA